MLVSSNQEESKYDNSFCFSCQNNYLSARKISVTTTLVEDPRTPLCSSWLNGSNDGGENFIKIENHVRPGDKVFDDKLYESTTILATNKTHESNGGDTSTVGLKSSQI